MIRTCSGVLRLMSVALHAVLVAAIPAAQTSESAKLTASDAVGGEMFGASLALDGDVMVMGSFNSSVLPHAAYVFERVGNIWTEVAKLTSPVSTQREFGAALDVEGECIAVGAPREEDQGVSVGAVYLFERVGSSWVQQARVVAPDGSAGDRFGLSVSLDGDRLFVGAPFDDDANPTHSGTESGSAYVFSRNGAAWTFDIKIVPADTAALDLFGAVLSGQGDELAVSAPGDDVGGGWLQGSVYMFRRNGIAWIESTKLTASDGSSNDSFGTALSLESDFLLVGAPSGPPGGTVYSFARAGATWVENGKLAHSGTLGGDHFGRTLARSGNVAVVGALAADEKGQNSGTAYVYLRTPTGWTEVTRLVRTDPGSFDSFGRAVGVLGDRVMVGSPADDDAGPDAGAVYEFHPGVPVSYCVSKTNSLSCVAFVTALGVPSVTDVGPFRVEANQVLPNEVGFLFYGFKKANLTFHGGRLCVKAPFVRLLPLKNAKSVGTTPCSGFLQRNFNKHVQGGADPLLTAGQVVRSQWLQRDPGAPFFGDSLTDALQFTVLP